MKMVEIDAHKLKLLVFMIGFYLGTGGILGFPDVRAALVTKIISFDQADGFVVDGPNPNTPGSSQYIIEGMRVAIQDATGFLYPQRNSGLWLPQDDDSTSLGSEASFSGNFPQFSLSLDDPYAGQTFDVHGMTLAGYANSLSLDTSVTFLGTKLGGETVSVTTPNFNANSRVPLNFDFDNAMEDFTGLTSLTWIQRGTNRQFQFDNVEFSTVTAVPEPAVLIFMLVVAIVGVASKFRVWVPAISHSIG